MNKLLHIMIFLKNLVSRKDVKTSRCRQKGARGKKLEFR